MLESMSVFVFKSRNNELSSFPPRSLQFQQSWWCWFSPFGQENNKGQRLEAVLEQPLKVSNCGVHKLFAKGWVGFERSAMRFELQNWPEKKEIIMEL
jgi:hypothetical protein